jgi:hypothetical protein
MTRKLEDLFDLPIRDINNETDDVDAAHLSNDIQTNLPILPDTLAALDKIEAA